MEVHHHAHTARKKWTHYFWEFLMLFLAVFCGFLAENKREHMIEHQREKAYIKSFVQDLEQDTTQLVAILNTMDNKILLKDSLLAALAAPDLYDNSSRAHYYFELSRHFPDFIYTDRTIQQLKNSGGMRLIRNRAVADSIVDYDSRVRNVFVAQSQMNSMVLPYGLLKNKIFQIRLLDTANYGRNSPAVPLLTREKALVEELYNNMWDQKKFFAWLRSLDADLLQRGRRLIGFIKNEYHLR